MDFASRISITCFAASYGIGLANEILRLFWPRRWIRWLTTASVLAGLLAQTLFLVARGVHQQRLPMATQFESLIVVSWLLSVIYLYWLLRDRRLGSGLFLLPISLALVLFAGFFSDRGYRTTESAAPVLAFAHGMLLLVGTVFVTMALVAAVMYLVKVRQLKSAVPLAAIRLPSLERLDEVNRTCVYLAWPLLSFGILLGFSLRRMEWTDPKVLATMVAWCGFTLLAHVRYQPENRGRRVAVFTILACLAVLFSVLSDPFIATAHQKLTGVSG